MAFINAIAVDRFRSERSPELNSRAAHCNDVRSMFDDAQPHVCVIFFARSLVVVGGDLSLPRL